MAISIGSDSVQQIYLGADSVLSVCLGSELVWSETPAGEPYALKFTNLDDQDTGFWLATYWSPADLPSLEYSLDGSAWTELTVSVPVSVPAGGSAYLRANVSNDQISPPSGYVNVQTDGPMKVEGPLWSLCRKDGSDAPLSARGFGWLFTGDNGNCFSQLDIDLSGITKVPDRGLYRTFVNLSNQTGRVRGFENITDVGVSGLATTIGNSTLSVGEDGHLSFTKLSSVGDSGLRYAFIQVSAVSSTVFPELTYAPDRSFEAAFDECHNLRTASFPSLVNTGGSRAFMRAFTSCDSLEQVDFPNLTAISGGGAGSYMFQGCTALTSVNMPELKHIDGSEYMFHGCNGITCWEPNKLSSCTNLHHGFYQNTGLRRFWPMRLKQMGNFGYCCTNCYNLSDISMNSIEETTDAVACRGMFSHCGSLSSATFGKLKNIGTNGRYGAEYMFHACSSLTSFRASQLTSICGAEYMFMECSSLMEVHLPKLEDVFYANQMFRYCTSLSSIDLSSLHGIAVLTSSHKAAESMFSYCSELRDVNLSNLHYIQGAKGSAQYLMYSCPKLSSVNLDSLMNVSQEDAMRYAFANCDSLGEISFPALSAPTGKRGMQHIFENDYNLSVADFPELSLVQNTQFDAAFNNCSALVSANFPKVLSVYQQGFNNAFTNCVNLSTLYFPSLSYLGPSAFGNSTWRAFVGCDSLTSLHFRADAQAQVEACDGYDVNFGAPRGDFQFIYDL